ILAMEEHALLHRREEIDLLNLPITADQSVQRRLVESRQWEVGGRVTTGLGGPAMGDQRAQRCDKPVRQSLNRGTAMQLLAIRPLHPQPAPHDAPADLQQIAPAPARAAGESDRLARQSE